MKCVCGSSRKRKSRLGICLNCRRRKDRIELSIRLQERVLRFWLEGKSIPQIAVAMQCSSKNVEYHWERFRRRIGIRHPALIVIWAIKHKKMPKEKIVEPINDQVAMVVNRNGSVARPGKPRTLREYLHFFGVFKHGERGRDSIRRMSEGKLFDLYEATRASWRSKISKAHPDRGGSNEDAAAINAAWERTEVLFRRLGVSS